MCVVSMVGDGYTSDFPKRWPQFNDQLSQTITIKTRPDVSRDEFDLLKQEIVELKKLLLAAKEFDDATGQPECENEAKIKLIKDIAKLVGVDMDSVFKRAPEGGGDY